MDKTFTLYSDKAEDVATSSSFRQFKIDHFHLDLKVDFEQKTISGTETIQLQCIQDGQSELQLDIHPTLSVHEITFSHNARDWTTTQFLIRDFTNYGTTLVVKFPKPFNSDDKLQLAIKYKATDGPGVGMQTAFDIFCLLISILTAHAFHYMIKTETCSHVMRLTRKNLWFLFLNLFSAAFIYFWSSNKH